MYDKEDISIRFFSPRKELRSFVESYAILECGSGFFGNKVVTCLPNGKCGINIQLSGEINFFSPIARDTKNHDNITICGQMFNLPNSLHVGSKIKLLVATFVPFFYYQLFGFPQTMLLNNRFYLEELIGCEGVNITERILEAKDDCSRIDILESFLLKKLISSRNIIPSYLPFSIEFMNSNNGFINIKKLLSYCNISERCFENNFKNIIGLPPKKYSRIIRVIKIAKLLQNNDSFNLDKISDLYFDQSHMIHDFREVMLTTPGEFINNSKKYIVNYYGQFLKLN